TLPLMSTDIWIGFWSLFSRLLAWVCGRSSGPPTASSGADPRKMMSSPSITSTIGVTLISATTGLRRPRRPPPPDELATFMPMIERPNCPSHYTCPPSAPLVDLTRQDGGKFIGEAFEPLGLPVH